VPIPKTFSAPPDTTFEALGGYVPSKEDALRYAVWLMLMADDVNRKAHSNVREDADAGVNIYQGRPEYDPLTLAIRRLPCQIVDIAPNDGRWTYETSHAGQLEIVIGIALLETANTSMLGSDVTAPPLTMETKLDRVRQILMRGTLWNDDMTTGDGKVIDPYRTALKEDGTYDMAGAKFIATLAPEIRPTGKRTFVNKRVRTQAEADALDPVRDFAVSFGWRARYIVNVPDRDLM
jgi:hypothetical protein